MSGTKRQRKMSNKEIENLIKVKYMVQGEIEKEKQ